MKTTLLFAAGLLLGTCGFSQNVGVGTTNPVFKLDVRNGSINVDSVYRIGTITVFAVPGYHNLFVGNDAGRINTGFQNTFIGFQSGYSNSEGYFNCFFGDQAGAFNTTGIKNSFFGTGAGFNITIGNNNSFFGVSAGFSNVTGNNNTALGDHATAISGAINNSTAIGQGAVVDASNKVRIGSTSVTSIGGQVGWSTFSDGRFKQQVQEDIQGLAFIKKLRTVSYLVDHIALNNFYPAVNSEIDKRSSSQENANSLLPEIVRQSGFIAQEVEQAAKELGFSFSGIDKPNNDKALYGLRYGDFVVPLVKAVQEQQLQIESLVNQNRELEKTVRGISEENYDLKKRIEVLEKLINPTRVQN